MHKDVNGGTILTAFVSEYSLLTAHTHSTLVLFIGVPRPCDLDNLD